MTHFEHSFAHDFLVLVFGDVLLRVVRLERQFHFLIRALLLVQLLDVLRNRDDATIS